MKYADGQDAKLGDIVDLGGEMTGTVVLVVKTGDHVPAYDPEDWTNLDDGVLMESKEAGLIHYPDEHDHWLGLVSRAEHAKV